MIDNSYSQNSNRQIDNYVYFTALDYVDIVNSTLRIYSIETKQDSNKLDSEHVIDIIDRLRNSLMSNSKFISIPLRVFINHSYMFFLSDRAVLALYNSTGKDISSLVYVQVDEELMFRTIKSLKTLYLNSKEDIAKHINLFVSEYSEKILQSTKDKIYRINRDIPTNTMIRAALYTSIRADSMLQSLQKDISSINRIYNLYRFTTDDWYDVRSVFFQMLYARNRAIKTIIRIATVTIVSDLLTKLSWLVFIFKAVFNT